MPTNAYALRAKLQAQQTTWGMWVTMESPHVTEVAVELGLDWVVVDMEHGHLDWKEVVEHLRVVHHTTTAALVRIPELQQSTIKRSLDLGAAGIIVPMMHDGEMMERAMAFARYAPRGVRGVGGERAVRWGLAFQEYLHSANRETLVIPLIETRSGIEHFQEILDVEGVEAVFFGPADMSASYGHLGEWEGPGIAEKIQAARHAASERGYAAGVLARSPADAIARRDQGFRMIGLGADVNLLIRALRESLDTVRNTRPA